MIHATAGFVDGLLGMAADADPNELTVAVATTQARELPECGLDPEIPVFTHFYMPNTAGSVSFVFGYDLGTPVGQSDGVFVAHPEGSLSVSQTDDLHEVVFVAVPPWERAHFAAFDRRGEERELTILDVEPPAEAIDLPQELLDEMAGDGMADDGMAGDGSEGTGQGESDDAPGS